MNHPNGCTPNSNRQSEHVKPVHSNDRRVGPRWFVDWKCSSCKHTWTTDAGTRDKPNYRKEQ